MCGDFRLTFLFTFWERCYIRDIFLDESQDRFCWVHLAIVWFTNKSETKLSLFVCLFFLSKSSRVWFRCPSGWSVRREPITDTYIITEKIPFFLSMEYNYYVKFCQKPFPCNWLENFLLYSTSNSFCMDVMEEPILFMM